jgi:hypothetical protein
MGSQVAQFPVRVKHFSSAEGMRKNPPELRGKTRVKVSARCSARRESLDTRCLLLFPGRVL